MKILLINPALHKKYVLLALITVICFAKPVTVSAQTKRASNKATSAFATGKYRNLFKEAGYSQHNIDKKLAKAYYYW